MNQCLRCKKPCGDNEDFCEDCQSHVHSRLQQNETQSRALPSKQFIENVLAGARSSREAGAKTISASLEYDAADLNDEDMSTPGLYNDQITTSAIGKGGGAIQNSPVTIPVTLTVI